MASLGTMAIPLCCWSITCDDTWNSTENFISVEISILSLYHKETKALILSSHSLPLAQDQSKLKKLAHTTEQSSDSDS